MIRSHHIAVTRTARYCTLGEATPSVRELWIACHGYGQLAARFLEGLGALAEPTRLIVAPEALSRFYVQDTGGLHHAESPVGATWMTREDRLSEIDDYVAYLEQLFAHVRDSLDSAAPVRTVALGFSQGTATISRWAARTRTAIDDLVLWGGRLPSGLDLAEAAVRWRRLRVTLVGGSRDRWLTEARLREDQAALEGHGIPARVLTFDGGHRLDDGTLRAIAASP